MRSMLRCLMVVTSALGFVQAQEIDNYGMMVVSSAASPMVSYSVAHKGGALEVQVSVDAFPDEKAVKADAGVRLQLGVAAAQELRLTEKDATIKAPANGRGAVFQFVIPDAKLAAAPADLQRLRMGFSVEWAGGAFGQARQRESFLQGQTHSPHGGLGDSSRWQSLNLSEFEKAVSDRKLQIAFEFNQPIEGKATLVIEDEKGARVRNLVSGQPMARGAHRIVWDGANDKGDLMPPGNYRWRSLSHPGLKPNYLFSFCNGPGSNHGTFHAAATNGKDIFFGTPVSEGGHQLVHLDVNGKMIRGFNAPHGIGLGRVAIAADEKYLYAAYDGTGWGTKVDRSKPDWKAEQRITLLRWELASGNLAAFGKSNFVEVRRYFVGPGSPEKRSNKLALNGLAHFKGKLYLGDDSTNSILEIDPANGVETRKIAVEGIVALAASAETLYALAGQRVLNVDLVKGAAGAALGKLDFAPTGLAVHAGVLYISDPSAHVVRTFSEKMTPMGVIGKADGIKPGAYDPLALHHPAGLVIAPDGHLWVTEEERWKPKRLAAFTLKGEIWKEFFGPTAYGASNSGFDPADVTRWFGQGTLFKLDYEAKSATPISVTGGEEGRSYRYHRQDGRTFVIATGKATYVEELLPDNTLKPLAFLSTAHLYSYAQEWNPPAEFVTAFQRDYPNEKYVTKGSGRPGHGFGMLWVDKNGDAKMQAEEIEFSTAAQGFAGASWGNDFGDLTMRAPAKFGKKTVLVSLKPDGWYPGGAPKYPALNDAVKAGVPIDLAATNGETTTDRFGTMIVNSDPEMRAFAPDGKLNWSYPNRWTNVHGSHKAPLPTAGELQGVLFFTGVAKLDEKSDVIAMNGNHGRAFFMSSDGMYIDEMFPDCRLMTNPQAGGVGILGGECFGGTFGRSDKDGNYYFQGGGIEYRIYRVDGLREVVRGGGTFAVVPEQIVAAERNQSRVIAAKAAPNRALISMVKTPPVIDGKSAEWTGEPAAQWNRGNQFPVTARAAHDGKLLYLSYTVKDASPWVNNGKDWQSLFKTGDGVDLQLGTNPSANVSRSGPVPGDMRLFVAPFEGGSTAVLYRHRLPGAADSVVFQSPWRNEKVDSVKKLESAKIAVARSGDSYHVEVSVPLTELGIEAAALGKTLRGDFGIIYGDAEGTTNIFRNYWANLATGLINDVPGEIMLSPNLWGDVKLEAAQ